MANHLKLEAKKGLPQALIESFGILGEACRKVGCSYEAYYNWCRADPEYKAACEKAKMEGELSGADFVENSLYKKILEGDTTCTIFYAKTKLRHRGYKETTTTNLTPDFNKINLASLNDEQLTRLIEDNTVKEIEDQS